jgi:hypothetical protein
MGHNAHQTNWNSLMILEAAWTVMFIGFYAIMAAAIERSGEDCLGPPERYMPASFFFCRIEQTNGNVRDVQTVSCAGTVPALRFPSDHNVGIAD